MVWCKVQEGSGVCREAWCRPGERFKQGSGGFARVAGTHRAVQGSVRIPRAAQRRKKRFRRGLHEGERGAVGDITICEVSLGLSRDRQTQ